MVRGDFSAPPRPSPPYEEFQAASEFFINATQAAAEAAELLAREINALWTAYQELDARIEALEKGESPCPPKTSSP